MNAHPDSEEPFPFPRVAVVGLGLMGTSLCKALKEALSVTIYGIDRRDDVLAKATTDRVIDEGALLSDEKAVSGLLSRSSLVVLGFYAEQVVPFLKTYVGALGKDTLVSDLCGLKTPFLSEAQKICRGRVEYLSVHPMAGKEKQGYDYGDAELFFGAPFLITPTSENTSRSIENMKALARVLGCGRVTVLAPQEHDRIMAYTSHLPHVLAAVLVMCLSDSADMSAFTGGSFRDATRVADINAALWARLFLDNRQQLMKVIDAYRGELSSFETYLQQSDLEGLTSYLEEAGARKRSMNRRDNDYGK